MEFNPALFSAIQDDHFASLDRSPSTRADHALAHRHAPLIRFDEREPFLPSAAGYTIFRESDRLSPSYPRRITLPPTATTAIEYAIWWDWDMNHLYDLEHIWVYLDAAENLVTAEASWHGGYNTMRDEAAHPPTANGQLVVCSEPGKHAFAPSPLWLQKRAAVTRKSCNPLAGRMGVHVTPLFEGIIQDRNPLNNRLVQAFLAGHRFEPSFTFTQQFALGQAALVPWGNLFQWIPGRITWWLDQLARLLLPLSAYTLPIMEPLVRRVRHLTVQASFGLAWLRWMYISRGLMQR